MSEFNIDFDICNEAESKGGNRAGSAEEFKRNRLTCVGPGLEVDEAAWKK